MATLYVRDVPERLYKRLRARARRNGRSLNAEALAILEEATERDVDVDAIVDRLEARARKINLPPDAKPSDVIIREGREERERHLRRLLGD